MEDLPAGWSQELSLYFKDFSTEEPPQWRVTVERRPEVTGPSTPRVQDAGDSFLLRWSRFEGQFWWRTHRGVLWARSAAVTGTFLRVFLSHVLAREGGLLVHGAGFSGAHGASIFCGPSGSGKSTLAKRLPCEKLLSDEIVLLRKTQGGWRVHGTPFAGEVPFSSNAHGPLTGLYFLNKSPAWSKSSLLPEAALPKFLRCVLAFSQDPSTYKRLLDLGGDLVQTVRCAELSFPKSNAEDPDFDDFFRL